MTSEEIYYEVGNGIKGAVKSQMFGKPCYKVNNKAFVCLFQESMVFKLDGKPHEEVLQLPGAFLFDPSEKGRPMKQWVQVPFNHKDQWSYFAKAAFSFVKEHV